MTVVTVKDVRHLARLSSLNLTDEEIPALRADLERILTYIEQLSELDTTGVEPTYQVTGLENVWRSDEAKEHPAGRDGLVGLAAQTHDNQIKIPKVL